MVTSKYSIDIADNKTDIYNQVGNILDKLCDGGFYGDIAACVLLANTVELTYNYRAELLS